MSIQDSTPTPEQRANSIVTDPLKRSGITVVTIPVLLLDEQWQQLEMKLRTTGSASTRWSTATSQHAS